MLLYIKINSTLLLFSFKVNYFSINTQLYCIMNFRTEGSILVQNTCTNHTHRLVLPDKESIFIFGSTLLNISTIKQPIERKESFAQQQINSDTLSKQIVPIFRYFFPFEIHKGNFQNKVDTPQCKMNIVF